MNRTNDNRKDPTNLLRVLKEVCYREDITRPEIAKSLGLTTMSISNMVKELIARDIIVETRDLKSTGVGRKPMILALSENCPRVIAVNITRREIVVAEMDLRANKISESSASMPSEITEEAVMSLLYAMIDRAVSESGKRIIAIGVSCFGPVDTEEGVIIDPQSFGGIENLEIKKPLMERYGLPVEVIHDTSASALAEKRFGAQKDTDSFVYVRDVGGTGCGLILGGNLFGGDCGLSGELGHFGIDIGGKSCSCGSRGCLDSFINTDIIRARINEAHNFRPELSWEDIVGLYNSPTEMFSPYFEEFADALAYALVSINNLLDVSTFVLEYRGQDSGDRLERLVEEKARAMVKVRRRPISVVQSSFRADSSLIGACSTAVDAITDGSIPFLS